MTSWRPGAIPLLLGRPPPEVLAVLNAYVDPSARTMATTTGGCVAIPEYARALLRGWAGHWLRAPASRSRVALPRRALHLVLPFGGNLAAMFSLGARRRQ